MFSVIVAVYNVEKYIHMCINSILNQSYKNFELILVDDGSPDHCGAICDEYAKKDSRITVIHKKNGGLVSARKAGLSAANGNYIFNIDGDDYIADNLFENIADIVEKYDPGIIVYDPVRIIAEKKIFEQKHLKKGLLSGSDLYALKEKLIYNPNMHAFRGIIYPGIVLKAIKRELLIKYQMRVPDKIKIGEDFAVTVPAIFDADEVYFSNIDGYYYRHNEASMTCKFDKNAIEDIRNLVEFLDTVLDYEKFNTKYQMAAYIINRLFSALVYASRGLKSYAELKKIVAEIDPFLLNKIMDFQYSIHDLKSAAISFSIKCHLWWLFWLLYHNRKQY